MRTRLLFFLLPLGLFAAEPDSLDVEALLQLPDAEVTKAIYTHYNTLANDYEGDLPRIMARLQQFNTPVAKTMLHLFRAQRYRWLEISNSVKNELIHAHSYLPKDSLRLRLQLYKQWSVHKMYVAEYEACMLYNDSAMELATKLQLKDEIENLHINRLPVVYLFSRDEKRAQREFQRISKNSLDLDTRIRLWLIYSNIWGSSGALDSALVWTQKAMNELENPSVTPVNKMRIMAQHARVLQNMGNYQEALDLLVRSAEYGKSNGLVTTSSEEMEVAQILHQMGDSDSALVILNNLENLMHTGNNLESLMAIYTIRYRIYYDQGNFLNALQEYQKYYAIKDSVFTNQTAQQIAEIETAFEVAKKDADLLLLKEKQRLQDQRILWYSSLFVVVLLVLGLGWRLQVIRSKQRLAEKERDQARLSLKLQDQEMEKELLQEQVDHKSRQLTAQALHMARRQKMLEEVQEQLKQLSKEGVSATNLRQLSNKLVIEQKDEGEWELFQKGFEEVHPNFYTKLREKHPSISTKEERLLALILLGLDGKECARILHIAPGSVKMARHRLRKKLGLPEGHDLEEFVRTL